MKQMQKNKLKNFIKKNKPNFVLGLHGQVAVTKSIKDPIYDLHSNFLSNFEKACKENLRYRSKKINYGDCSAHPHNTYIQFLAETGLIGFSFFGLFLLMILFKVFKNFNLDLNKFSFIHLSILFWPIMSTGSLLKNWYGIEVFLVIGLLISLTNNCDIIILPIQYL